MWVSEATQDNVSCCQGQNSTSFVLVNKNLVTIVDFKKMHEE